jgi:hypothetical protein
MARKYGSSSPKSSRVPRVQDAISPVSSPAAPAPKPAPTKPPTVSR